MEVAGKAKESPKVFWNYVKRKTVEKTRIPKPFIDDRDHSKGMAESQRQNPVTVQQLCFYKGDK